MSETNVPQTPEAVAYQLLYQVLAVEKQRPRTKQVILDNYRDCLKAVRLAPQ